MKQKILLALSIFFFTAGAAVAQTQASAQTQTQAPATIVFNKIDTTMKIGKAGYRFTTRNKSIMSNPVNIRPIGFDNTVQTMDFPLRGRVAQVQVDDLNGDGWPDLIMFIYTDSNARNGTVYVLVSDGNKSVTPCPLPDASLDGKINTGYKGGDEFTLMEGTLIQKFPVYNTGDSKDNPTGGHRVILYQLGKGEGGTYKLTRIRFYDSK